MQINRFKQILILIFTILCCNVFSQSEKEKDDSLNSCMERLIGLVSVSDYTSHKEDITKALSYALSLNYDTTISNLYNSKAIYYLSVNSKGNALKNIDSAIVFAKKATKKNELINAYNTKAFIYQTLFEFDKATEWSYKTLELINRFGEEKDKIPSLVNLSNIFIQNKEYNKAESVLKEALQLSKIVKDEWAVLACTQSLGVVYNYLNNSIAAKKQFKQLVILSKKIKRKDNEADAYSGLAHIFLKDNQLDSAEVYYKKAFDIYTSRSEYQYLAYLNFGKFYAKLFEQNKSIITINLAISYTDTAYKIALKTGNMEGQQRILSSLSEIHKIAKNYKKAFEYLKAHNLMKDSVFTIEKEGIIKNYEAKYQLSEKENKIITLNVEKLKTEKVSANLKTMLIVGSSIFLLFIVFLYFFVKNNKQQKKIMQQQQVTKEQQQKVEFEKFKSKALKEKVDAAENERDKLSRELHDSIAGKLYVLKNNPSNTPEIVEEVEKLNVALRKLIANFSKPIFEDIVSLEESLYLFLNESLANSKIKYSLDVVLENEDEMAEELKFDLYRISQELVMNVIKHAEATYIAIAILQENKKLEIIVSDNGKGFVSKKKGHGYNNIAARLKKYNAQLSKTSKGGAEIIINFDL